MIIRISYLFSLSSAPAYRPEYSFVGFDRHPCKFCRAIHYARPKQVP